MVLFVFCETLFYGLLNFALSCMPPGTLRFNLIVAFYCTLWHFEKTVYKFYNVLGLWIDPF